MVELNVTSFLCGCRKAKTRLVLAYCAMVPNTRSSSLPTASVQGRTRLPMGVQAWARVDVARMSHQPQPGDSRTCCFTLIAASPHYTLVGRGATPSANVAGSRIPFIRPFCVHGALSSILMTELALHTSCNILELTHDRPFEAAISYRLCNNGPF
jgi:hypothetical protein